MQRKSERIKKGDFDIYPLIKVSSFRAKNSLIQSFKEIKRNFLLSISRAKSLKKSDKLKNLIFIFIFIFIFILGCDYG